jgi:hypothetical protein
VIALDEDGAEGKGSGRSIAGVDLGAAIIAARDSGLIVAGGGHAMAAGLTVAGDKLEALAEWLDERLAGAVARARPSRRPCSICRSRPWTYARARRHARQRRTVRRRLARARASRSGRCT